MSVGVSGWAGVLAVVSVGVSVEVPVEAVMVSVLVSGLAAVSVLVLEQVSETPGRPAHRYLHPASAGVGIRAAVAGLRVCPRPGLRLQCL